MRKILCLFFLGMAMLFASIPVFAQERTLTGTVMSSDDNTPLSNVTVRVKGTARITQTDQNGKFTVTVTPADVLQFSFVGYAPMELRVGNATTLSAMLRTQEGNMNEVVVTALGIKKSKPELGYSVTEVKGAEVAQTQRDNF